MQDTFYISGIRENGKTFILKLWVESEQADYLENQAPQHLMRRKSHSTPWVLEER
jgi:hypothetical protein